MTVSAAKLPRLHPCATLQRFAWPPPARSGAAGPDTLGESSAPTAWTLAALLGAALAGIVLATSLLLPALLAAGFGIGFEATTLRPRRDCLASATPGFVGIVSIVARNLPAWTNGATGLDGVAAPGLLG